MTLIINQVFIKHLRSQVSVLSTVDETEFTWRNNWPLQKFMAQLLLKYKMFLPCLGACALIIPVNSRIVKLVWIHEASSWWIGFVFRASSLGYTLYLLLSPHKNILKYHQIMFSLKKWYTIYKQRFSIILCSLNIVNVYLLID